MITDAKNTLGEGQSIAGAAGSVASTNVLKVDAADFGKGKKLDVIFIMNADVDASTLQFTVQTSDAEGFGSGVAVLGQTGAIAFGNLTKGTEIRVTLNGDVLDYIRANYTRGGTIATGSVSAYLVAQ